MEKCISLSNKILVEKCVCLKNIFSYLSIWIDSKLVCINSLYCFCTFFYTSNACEWYKCSLKNFFTHFQMFLIFFDHANACANMRLLVEIHNTQTCPRKTFSGVLINSLIFISKFFNFFRVLLICAFNKKFSHY